MNYDEDLVGGAYSMRNKMGGPGGNPYDFYQGQGGMQRQQQKQQQFMYPSYPPQQQVSLALCGCVVIGFNGMCVAI